MQRKFLIVGVAVLAVVGFAGAAYANHSWGGYHWARTANPFTLKLGDDVSGAWDTYLAHSPVDWTVAGIVSPTVVAGSTNPKNCKAVAGRVEVCNSKYGNTGWLGIASIWASGTHITQGTVKLNDTYFNKPQYNTPAWRQMVVCQEVAHTLGLDHQDEIFTNPNLGTCMDYTNDPLRDDGAGNNLYPNAHDYEELGIIYAHLDTTTTLSQSTATIGATMSEWGRAVRFSADGKPSLFVKDLGNGQKVITHVLWAQE